MKANKKKKTLTFRYHPRGFNLDGNNGPSEKSKSWLEVTVPDTGDRVHDTAMALSELPEKVQLNINKKLKQRDHTGARDLRTFLVDTSGWGVGFTFGCEEWGDFKYLRFYQRFYGRG